MMEQEERYVFPQQEWNEEKCRKLAKAVQRDGLGTPYPFRGYVGNILPKSQNYNGGTIVDGEWYKGVVHPLPKIPNNFKFVYVSTWGLRIIEVQ